MRLLLVRHAQADTPNPLQTHGWTDLPLSEVGRRQATLLAQRLDRERIDACHSSDLCRAAETAAVICCSRDLVVTRDSRMRELHFGDWEGLTYHQMCRADSQLADQLSTDPLRTAPPRGETLGQLTERVAGFLEATRNGVRLDAPTVLVVAHRGSLQVLLCLLLGLPTTKWWEFHLAHASLSELELYSEGAVLNFLNDTHHLREEDPCRPGC